MADASPSTARAPFGRYLLDELMARGGMGEVFRAVAVGAGGFEKPVVVKRILPALGDAGHMSEMFIEEARLMSRLVHPNIVQVIDFGQGENDDYFLVLELVDGVDLRVFGKAYAADGKTIPIGLCAFIATQIARGLSHAHTKAYRDGRTLVHRDVSPGNVLLSRVGEVKVADFGVALVADPREVASTQTVAGKLGYMAPEQISGETVDARADIFSLGVVLFQLLTGERPFEGEELADEQESANQGRMRDIGVLRSDLGADLAAVIEQSLSPDPDRRFDTVRAFSKAIELACRSDDVVIANADDLALEVERVADARARGKPVVSLSNEEGRELTRTGAFTMRVTANTRVTNITDVTSASTISEKVVAEEPLASNEPIVVPVVSTGRWIPPLLAGALALVGLLWWSARDEAPAVAPPQRNTAPSPPLTSPVVAPVAPPSIPSDTARPLPPPPPPRSKVPVVAVPTPRSEPVPSAPDVACRGRVLLAGKGSWWVSGGPTGRVQAPGSYEWPCGSYGLSGTSRVDGRVVSRGVSITAGGNASARFE